VVSSGVPISGIPGMVCDHPWQETPIGGLVPHYPSFSGNSISKKLLTSQLGVYKKRKKDFKKIC
jgi:hypothetical protein